MRKNNELQHLHGFQRRQDFNNSISFTIENKFVSLFFFFN
jgi:hypothetical protein